ncbi:hypothetical protein ACFE04_018824 [Oxalis oulophora]
MKTITQSYLCPSLPSSFHNTTQPKTCQSVHHKFIPSSSLKLDQKAGIGCVAMNRELKEGAMINNEETEELMQWGEKCKGSEGVVEVLECLEREAIMGDDHGKEPTDYNRRAQIFYKSSRVFQALKELKNDANN